MTNNSIKMAFCLSASCKNIASTSSSRHDRGSSEASEDGCQCIGAWCPPRASSSWQFTMLTATSTYSVHCSSREQKFKSKIFCRGANAKPKRPCVRSGRKSLVIEPKLKLDRRLYSARLSPVKSTYSMHKMPTSEISRENIH